MCVYSGLMSKHSKYKERQTIPGFKLNYSFPFQIADFGLSKWRMMSLSQSRSSKSAPEGGTIVYMPPENYEPGQKARASVKHDIYRYSMLLLLRVNFA